MVHRYAVVVTTINPPTQAIKSLQAGSHNLAADLYLIGDSKSPSDFLVPGARWFDLKHQTALSFRYARACPTRHYARKNIGYLLAMQDGVDVIIETDDDNLPRPSFWRPRLRQLTGDLVSTSGWCNAYSYFTDALIWPRGLPLNRVREIAPPVTATLASGVDCPIQQGLADENPDVDAIYRLILPLPQSFRSDRCLILGEGVWCPFNSQNTTFWREAFPLLYLPYHCSFRMTDIWRSFVAQRLAWTCGWAVGFTGPTVWQQRNEHDLMRDFAEEVPGYLNNDRIRKTLEDLDFAPGIASLSSNLVRAYDALIGLEVVGGDERQLLDAWRADLDTLAASDRPRSNG